MKKIIFILSFFFSLYCEASGIPVLQYHQITTTKAPGDTVISLEKFKEQMKYLHDNGYNTITMSDLLDVMTNKRQMSNKDIVLTFDDGWTSVLSSLSTLDFYKMKATYQIITSNFGDEYKSEYLNVNHIKAFSRENREIESHTVSHRCDDGNNLVTWDEGKNANRDNIDIINEIEVSKITLEQITGKAVNFIAWPCGIYNAHLLKLAKQVGYKGAMMAWGEGGNSPGDDPFQIKRLTINGNCSINQFAQIVKSRNSLQCK